MIELHREQVVKDEAKPCDDRREPIAQAMDFRNIRMRYPQPGVLHSIIRLAVRAEDTTGNKSQVVAMLLEMPHEVIFVAHMPLTVWCPHEDDAWPSTDVTACRKKVRRRA
ncbi:hypothetical protein NBE95_15650 [Paracoccus sp. TOH]|nr:hypothetical protein [Paracoccus sp. TOH]WJS85590.1 hypothetical protein NBE95_15650 [Paracoccus sp. TOH]